MNQKEQERRERLMKMQAERLPEIKKRFNENQNHSENHEVKAVETGESVILEEVQKRHFNSNFKPGGKDAGYARRNNRKFGDKSNSRSDGESSSSYSSKSGYSNRYDNRSSSSYGNRSEHDDKYGDKPNNHYGDRSSSRTSRFSKSADQKAPAKHQMELPVSTKKGDMVHHQRMLSQDVNAQATQHIIGVPVNKSRYNGYNGVQVTKSQLTNARQDPNSVLIIPIGGTGEFGIGKNMTVIQYKNEAIVIYMGVLFASDDYPGVNYMIPDVKYLEDNMDKIKAICFTHAHLDHIGGCKHILPKFNPLTPIYGTNFTIGMIKKQMSELTEVPDMNYIAVDPLKHEHIAVSENLSVEFIHTLHSIPGNCALVIRTPNGVIYVSGDWRTETNPLGVQTDYEELDKIVKEEGITLMLNESTNIDSPGHHPHSEFDVGENLGLVMDHYANGRVMISCFSSQIARIGMILE